MQLSFTPIHPDDVPGRDHGDDQMRAGSVASRRTFGRWSPSRRTFGRYTPSRRTFGFRGPSRRTFGRWTPSQRTFGRRGMP